jgi:hypothetical protein
MRDIFGTHAKQNLAFRASGELSKWSLSFAMGNKIKKEMELNYYETLCYRFSYFADERTM